MNGMNHAASLLAGLWMSMACAAAAADVPAAFDVGTMHVELHGERGSTVILIPGLAAAAGCGKAWWQLCRASTGSMQ